MPSEAWTRANEVTGQSPVETRRAPQGARTSRVRRGDDPSAVESFVYGVADTITFGFLDEAGGFIDAIGLTKGRRNIWNSSESLGELVDENIDQNRAIVRQAEEAHETAYMSGQLTGGLVPIGRAASSVRGMVGAGAAYGAVYGLGSGEDGMGDRLLQAANFGATGALGGYILGGIVMPLGREAWNGARTLLRRGAPVRVEGDLVQAAKREALSPIEAPAAVRVKPAVQAADASPVRPAVTAADVLEDGALLTARELAGDPGAARAALSKRIGAMSQEQAQRLFVRIEKAEAEGTIFADPHYRSLLKVDLEGTGVDTESLIRAAELFEEATEQLAKRAGIGPRTAASVEAEVTRELKKGVTLGELEDAFEQSQRGVAQTRIAQHHMVMGAAKVVRLREQLLPKLLAGDPDARERVAEELTRAAYQFTLARGIVSNAGRALGSLSRATKARTVEVVDDVYELESAAAVRARVDESLARLGDENLKTLLARIRTVADAEKLERLLMNADDAEAFNAWSRTLNTVSTFLRSNALTPATAAFSIVSVTANDFFRNDLAKRWAARGLARQGRLEEGLALRLERQAGRAVYWRAHKAGLKALLKRVQWEFWSDVERVAGVGWGSGKVAASARAQRSDILASGFAPDGLREFTEAPRLSVKDVDTFNEKLAAGRGDTALANVIYHLHRARAVTANTLDALGSASMKLFTGAVDDWGREFVRIKETYAQATRFAIREALELGVPAERLGDHAAVRAKELAEMPTAEMLNRVESALMQSDDLTGEAAFLSHLHGVADKEADRVLLMDGPQSTLGKASANFLTSIDRLGVVLPYIRTPIRLFEQGVINYGPFAKLSREVQEVIRKGNLPGATEEQKLAAVLEQARVEVGTMVFQAGLVLGLAGAFTATNGSYENSANLDAGPATRLNFPGGGFVEFARFDPFSFTVAMGGLVGQAFRGGFADGTEYDQEQAFKTALGTAILGARDGILDKTYLTGLRDILAVEQGDDDTMAAAVAKIVQGAAPRLLPMAGIGRQINETFSASAIEAANFTDQMLRHIPGAAWWMAPRIDPLGDEVKSRVLGLNFGNSERTEGEPISDVKRQLRDLGINITTIRKSDPDGFDLTSEELSEVRRVRAKEAVNDRGLTMHEALEELFADPWFQALPSKDQKREEIVSTMREFNKPAWAILAERSPSYASKRRYTKSLADYIAEGMSRREAEASALGDVEYEGLPTEGL